MHTSPNSPQRKREASPQLARSAYFCHPFVHIFCTTGRPPQKRRPAVRHSMACSLGVVVFFFDFQGFSRDYHQFRNLWLGAAGKSGCGEAFVLDVAQAMGNSACCTGAEAPELPRSLGCAYVIGSNQGSHTGGKSIGYLGGKRQQRFLVPGILEVSFDVSRTGPLAASISAVRGYALTPDLVMSGRARGKPSGRQICLWQLKRAMQHWETCSQRVHQQQYISPWHPRQPNWGAGCRRARSMSRKSSHARTGQLLF